MILIGLGGNLASEAGGPRETCEAALARLATDGVSLKAMSGWYETAPVPMSDQPWFVNAVAVVETNLDPNALLDRLQKAELALGRVRTVANAARTVDLDLLAYNQVLSDDPRLILPHPRLHERAFVLYPLRDVAPDWRHPRLGASPQAMIDALPPGQLIRRYGEADLLKPRNG